MDFFINFPNEINLKQGLSKHTMHLPIVKWHILCIACCVLNLFFFMRLGIDVQNYYQSETII